jgi:multicomponent Na+:H+ antiporter subunit F
MDAPENFLTFDPGEPLSVVLPIVFAVLGLAMLIAFIRLLRGPSLPDRVIALDLMGTQAVAMIVAFSIGTGETAFLQVAIVLALVSFLGTVAFGYYMEKRGRP